jgi:hypothetical protein
VTWTIVDGTIVILQAGLVVIRTWKHYGITHAVWQTFREMEDNSSHTDTLCCTRPNVSWKNTSKFRNKVDCMSCLVRMSRAL